MVSRALTVGVESTSYLNSCIIIILWSTHAITRTGNTLQKENISRMLLCGMPEVEQNVRISRDKIKLSSTCQMSICMDKSLYQGHLHKDLKKNSTEIHYRDNLTLQYLSHLCTPINSIIIRNKFTRFGMNEKYF